MKTPPKRTTTFRYSRHLLLFLAITLGTACLRSQESPTTTGVHSLSLLPQAAGSPAQPSTQPAEPSEEEQQTKRILGIVPNFRSVSVGEHLPPQSVKDKFVTASEDSFDYSSVFIPALIAGYSLAENSNPGLGHGGEGYGRYLWRAAVDQTDENYMVEFFVPTITHEDTRFYTLGHGGFLRRTGYALSRVAITRTDSGSETFNLSEVAGSGIASGVSSFYYPSADRSLGSVSKEWGLDLGIDGAAYVVKEFWPDINRRFFHQEAGSSVPSDAR